MRPEPHEAEPGLGKSTPQAGGKTPTMTKSQRWVLVVAILGSALPIIDVTAMNVVSPRIQADLDASIAGLEWILSGYTLFFASLLLLGGACGDRYGRRLVFAIGSTVFALASMAAALAPDVPTLVVSRMVQGIGAALVVPGSLSLIGAAFHGRARTHAIGTWSGMSALMAVAGPVLGGVLTDLSSWRLVFYVNVPIALGLLVPLALRVAPQERPARAPSLDWGGAALITLGVAAVTTAFIFGTEHRLTDRIVYGPLVLGIGLIWWFVRYENNHPAPMLPPTIFRNRNIRIANLQTLVIYGALAAGMLYTPMRLLFLDDYSASWAGFAMMIVALVIGMLSGRVGRYAGRLGTRPFLIGGPLLVAIGYLLLATVAAPHALPADATTRMILTHYATGVLPGLFVIGLGMSAVAGPISATALSTIDDARLGLASGINNMASRLAALMAIVILGLVAVFTAQHMLDTELARGSLQHIAPELHDPIASLATQIPAITVPDDVHAAVTPEQAIRIQHALDLALDAAIRAVHYTCAALAFLGGVLGLRIENQATLDQSPA